MRKFLSITLIVLHIFVGIGAMVGGAAAIIDPVSPLGAPVDMLQYSPFDNFLIPGIILFTVVGLGNVLAGLLVIRDWKYKGYSSSVFTWAIVFWIVVQCIMIRAVVGLHVIFFVIGLFGAILAAIELFDKRLFPANIALDIVGKLVTKKR